jgi:hypothetical protein
MWEQIRDLHARHADVLVEIRLLKLTEAAGEAAEAFIGMHGLNSRKGVCCSRDDLLDGLADVIITAAVAMSGVTGGDVDEARSHLEQRLAVVTETCQTLTARRSGLPSQPKDHFKRRNIWRPIVLNERCRTPANRGGLNGTDLRMASASRKRSPAMLSM